MQQTLEEFIREHKNTALERNYIDPTFYGRYNTKRGLRNEDGTGVLVGLTGVGDVHGYIIDEGEKVPVEGRLRYRGIEIEEIVRRFQEKKRRGYEETVYLLLFGTLPNEEQLENFNVILGSKRDLPNGFTEDMVLRAPSNDIMNKLARSVLVSYSYDDNPDEISIENMIRQSIELIARFPTMVAYGYHAKRHYFHNESLFIHSPQPELGTAENLLCMIRPDMKYTPLEAEVLDLALVLHAEHGGGNNSAFSIRVVSSSGTDTYSAIAAGVGSLKGPKHGGANIKVIGMMEEIMNQIKDWDDEEELLAYLKKILKRKACDRSGLIYGIGHAVYTLSDPRAVLLKEKAEELALEKNTIEEFKLYSAVERLTPKAFYETKGYERIMRPNVDFYSGFIYRMLNIPKDLYTPIFAVGRIAGWCAHRIEEVLSGGRIIRPAYKSIAVKKHIDEVTEEIHGG
jgi:citrate synthase